MKKNAIAMVVGIMMALGAAQAWAQCPGGEGRGYHGHGKGHHGGFKHMKEELNLTDEQSKEIDQIHEDMREDAKPIREKLKALKERMHDLWSADQPDEQAILSLKREMNALHLQLSELRVQMKLDMMEILTPEQRAKFKEMKGKRKGKRGKHGKKGCGECPYKDGKK